MDDQAQTAETGEAPWQSEVNLGPRTRQEQADVNFNFFVGLRKRDRETRAARRDAEKRAEARRAAWLPVAGMVIIGASFFGGFAVARLVAPGDPVVAFKMLALIAAVLLAVAAFVTIGAHQGSPSLDLLGKHLAFAGALCAAVATVVLFQVDLGALVSPAETSPPASTQAPRFTTSP
jgi:hypothetical protein